ncbi:unnamed protein product [Coregonus sp. 'balchen']|nr:unnamed protein product [Coregonus sp. 'balchen']
MRRGEEMRWRGEERRGEERRGEERREERRGGEERRGEERRGEERRECEGQKMVGGCVCPLEKGKFGPLAPAIGEPIHGARNLEVVDVQSKQVTVRWEPFGYNVTRCHSYNLTVQYRSLVAGKDETREEVCYDTLGRDPQHTIHNLTPYTNLSVKLVLKNPEGVKESPEMELQTDEDVPGAVPVESIQGSAYEEKMILKWREPAQTYGIITQYEISYKTVSSFDPELDLSNQSGKVLKHANETSHIFLGLYPGSTYSFTLRASTAKGYGPPVITQFTTKISGQSLAPRHLAPRHLAPSPLAPSS